MPLEFWAIGSEHESLLIHYFMRASGDGVVLECDFFNRYGELPEAALKATSY